MVIEQENEMAERLATAATAVTYTAAASGGVFGAFTVNELAIIYSLGLATLTFIINIIFKMRMETIVKDKDG